MELSLYFKFILSFALILVAARIGGELAERYLKQPPVLGELIAGVIISPFSLGGLFHDPIILNFATIHNPFGIEGEFHIMEVFSEIAVIVLLFVAGVETDVGAFLRWGMVGGAVAVGGVILPFLFGYFATMLLCPEVGFSGWLCMGAVLTATSIGITVRILMDVGRLRTPEGTIILVAAVVDDILGLLILSAVISIAQTGKMDLPHLIKLFVLGFGLWFALLMIGVKLHRYISSFLLSPFKRSGTLPVFALLIGFLTSYLVTLFGLHPVVGAYVSGLIFASTKEKEEIMEKTRPIMLFLSPFFFCYLGMQVDLRLMSAGVIIAIVLIALATIGKLIGCAIPAKLLGKLSNPAAMIVGVGMVPRGEVGLVIAEAGFLAGMINRQLFGAAVSIGLVTTLITPTMLKPLLKSQIAAQT